MRYPEFIDNETFFSIDDSKSEVEKAMGLALNLRRIQWLTSTNFDNLDQLILEYLKTGLSIFDMEIGIVSKIDGDQYIIENTINQDNSISKDDVFQLSDTYCREVAKSHSVLGFPQVGKLKQFKNHPVYVNMKLEAYLSAPVDVGGELYGTLNFTSKVPRKYGFSEHERDLVALMAKSIGNFIEIKQKEQELIESNNRLKNLAGYVAHDLRNPLSQIHGFSQLIAENSSYDHQELARHINKSAEKSMNIVHVILETAAIGTGKVELMIERTNFSRLLIEVLSGFGDLIDKSGNTFKLDVEEGLMCQADSNRLEQVLSNLISNSLKYSHARSEIKVSLKRNKKHFAVFSISNSVADDSEKKDVQSIGFGLEIIREILRLHDSKLVVRQHDSLFEASFSLSNVD